jgi:hypothetical protein
VVVEYALFGDRADGAAGIDATGAHLNIPATFEWRLKWPRSARLG